MSIATPGDFSKSQLVDIQSKAEAIFANEGQNSQDYVAEVEAAKAILAEQTSKWTDLLDPDKDREIQVAWIQDCDNESEADSDDCQIGGAQAGTNSEKYALTIKRKVSFSVPEKEFRTNMFSPEEVVAKHLLKKKKVLDEFWAQRIVAFVDANAGINQVTSPYTNVGNDTFIPAPNWTPDLYGYIYLTQIMNKLRNSFILTGKNLFLQDWKAAMEAANADGSGAAKKVASQKKYFDLFNIESVLNQAKTFIIGRNAVSVAIKNYYGDAPVEYGNPNHKRFSMPSDNLPGVRYDVYYSTTCVNDETFQNFTLRTKGGIFLNPKGCNEDVTGIVSLVCGNA